MKEHNVIGTMQLLAACQRAPQVERLVVKSSTAVYGSSSHDPAMFTEDMSAKQLPRGGNAKDVLEVRATFAGSPDGGQTSWSRSWARLALSPPPAVRRCRSTSGSTRRRKSPGTTPVCSSCTTTTWW